MVEILSVERSVNKLIEDLKQHPTKIARVKQALVLLGGKTPLYLGAAVVNAAYGTSIPKSVVPNYDRHVSKLTHRLGFVVYEGPQGAILFLEGIAVKASELWGN